MKISPNLTLAEVSKSLTATRRGIDNEPQGEHLTNLIKLANNVFQPIRNHFDKPIFVSSGYRSFELNIAIGGAHKIIEGEYVATSQHCKGQAIDIDNDGRSYPTNKDIFWYIYDHLDFDQLIFEFGSLENPSWVHVSYKSEGNRKQVLRASKVKGRTIYTNFTDNR